MTAATTLERRLVAQKAFELYGGLCAYCRVRPATERDHVLPRSKGGPNAGRNRLPSCSLCNRAKDSLTFAEWMLATARYVMTGSGPVWIARWVDETLGGREQAAAALSRRDLPPLGAVAESIPATPLEAAV